MDPGFYDGIPNSEYHCGEGVSSSGLKKKTMSHYWAAYVDPDRERPEPTPAMQFGTACHTIILEPDDYASRHLVIPEGLDRRRKDDKAIIEDLEAQAREVDGTTIKFDDNVLVHNIGAAMARSRQWRKLHDVGLAERSYYWIDSDTGLLCKCRPDWQTWTGDTPATDDFVVDVKSAYSADQDEFERASNNLGYYVSAAFYLDGVEAVTGVRPAGFVFAVVEKEAPFATAFYLADEAMIMEGRLEYKRQLARIAEAKKTGVWAGYPDQIVRCGLPKYFKRKG